MNILIEKLNKEVPFLQKNLFGGSDFFVLFYREDYEEQLKLLGLNEKNYPKPPTSDIASYQYNEKPYIVLSSKKGVLSEISSFLNKLMNKDESKIFEKEIDRLIIFFHEMSHISDYQQDPIRKKEIEEKVELYGKYDCNVMLRTEMHSDINSILVLPSLLSYDEYLLKINKLIKQRKESLSDIYMTFPALEILKDKRIYDIFKEKKYNEINKFSIKLTEFTLNYDFNLITENKNNVYNLNTGIKTVRNYSDIIMKYKEKFFDEIKLNQSLNVIKKPVY